MHTNDTGNETESKHDRIYMYRLRENAIDMNFPNTLQSHVTQTVEQMQHTARAADRL